MGDLDGTFKTLLRLDPVGFVRLARGGAMDVRDAAPDEVVLPASSVRLADKVVRYRLRGERRWRRTHFEVEATPRWSAPRRVHEYWTLLHRDHTDLDSVLVVLRPGKRRAPVRDEYVVRDADGEEMLRFRFKVIELWTLDAKELTDLGPALLPLVPFARGAEPRRVRAAMRRLARVGSLQRRADLQGALAVFAEDRFPGLDWAAMIPQEVLVKSKFFERLRVLAEQSVRDEVRDEVRAEVRAEERARLVTQLVRTRLGRGAGRWTRAIKGADPEALDRLFQALIEVEGGDKAASIAVLERVLGASARPRRTSQRRSPGRASRSAAK